MYLRDEAAMLLCLFKRYLTQIIDITEPHLSLYDKQSIETRTSR